MFILSLLFAFISSKYAVPFLTNRTFESTIEKRQRNEVWLVLFDGVANSGSTPTETTNVASNFMNASKISMGMRYAIVNVNRYPDIPQKYHIDKIPTIYIFYEGGSERYSGRYEPSDIVKRGAAHLQDFVVPIAESWKSEFIAQPSAMLFSEKNKAPIVWRAISAHYFGKLIRIGYTNNTDLFFPFEVKKTPAIIFSNGTHQISYKGKMNFARLSDAIDKFFVRSLSSQTEEAKIVEGFAKPKRFRELCIGSRTHCVVVKMDKVTPKLEALRKSFNRAKMNWILGVEGLPYDFMKRGSGAWIYNPRKDAFVATEIDNLDMALESIVNGNAKWTKRDVLNKEL